MELWFIVVILFISFLMGGFLTVVVHRLPVIRSLACLPSLQCDTTQSDKTPLAIDLFFPLSFCPCCKKKLGFFLKIPLFSYLWLKARCFYCQKNIHWCYPVIELLTLIFSAIVIGFFKSHFSMLVVLVLTWGLISLSSIDLKYGILPDVLVLSLLWLGLLVNTLHTFVSPEQAILGASIGYLSLWLVAKAYYCFTKKEGMGYGDFKCFALIGAWVGVDALLSVLILASLSALLLVMLSSLKKININLQQTIAFGPHLALAGWLVLLIRH